MIGFTHQLLDCRRDHRPEGRYRLLQASWLVGHLRYGKLVALTTATRPIIASLVQQPPAKMGQQLLHIPV